MNDSGSPQEHPTPGPVPKPSDVGARMADPEEIRRTVGRLLERADAPGLDGDDVHGPDGVQDPHGIDPADLFEQAHEVLLEALSTVDRN